jgi:hypothetical protein
METVCSGGDAGVCRIGTPGERKRKAGLLAIAAVAMVVTAGASGARAGGAAETACRATKARAAGKLALARLKAFGANERKPNPARLAQALSKAQARYEKAVEAAERRAPCCPNGGAGETIGGLTEGFVTAVLAGMCPATTTTIGAGSTTTTTTTLPPAGPGLVITEVMYDPAGADDGFEWVELKNTGSAAVDLAGFSLGWGGVDYAAATLQLGGRVPAGGVFVVGGPESDASNALPRYDQPGDFAPDLQNAGSAGDGIALFAIPADAITPASVPIDAVVYGPNNDSGLIGPSGTAGPPDVADAPAGSSIERSAGGWQVQSAPTPNRTPF